MKKSLYFVLIVVMSVGLIGAVNYGAPWPPELVSPGNNQAASSNPPTLCAKVSNDPENDSISVRFEAWGGGEGNHASSWIPGSSGSTVCWTDDTPWSQGGHSWQARAKDSNENQSGASGDWGIQVPAASSGGGGGNNQASCSGSFYFSPSPPQPAGTHISIVAKGSCTNGVSHIKIMAEGKEIYTLNDNNGTVIWNTTGLTSGSYSIKMKVADKKAGYIFSVTDNYDIGASNSGGSNNGSGNSGGGNNCPSSSATLSPGNIAVVADYGDTLNLRVQPGTNANIISKIQPYTYVTVISGPKCADGYRWYEIGFDGKDGWAAEVGPDGQYNLILNGQPMPQNNPTAVPTGSCSGNMIVGETGRVTYTDGTSTRLRSDHSKSASIIFKMPEGYTFKVVGGPVCVEGFTWWQLETANGTGWAIEGDHSNQYIETWPPSQAVKQPVQPTSTQQPTAVPTQQINPTTDPCAETFVPKIHAKMLDDFIQCVSYVRNHRSDVKDIHGDAWTWAFQAETKYGFSVDSGNLNKAKPGDIVVWVASKPGDTCAGVKYPGHVALLVYTKSYGDGGLELHVNEANHCTPNCDGKVYPDRKYLFDKDKMNLLCISLIHPKPDAKIDFDGVIDPSTATGSNNQSNNQTTDRCSQYTWFEWIWCKLSGG